MHNAAAGYWSIATGSREIATSLSGGMAGFAMALREAWGLLAHISAPVLLVCFDMDGTGPLHAARPDIGGSCALAWLLDRRDDGALARLSRPDAHPAAADSLDLSALERLRRVNPTARGLTLLAALARGQSQRVVIESEQGNVAVELAITADDSA